MFCIFFVFYFFILWIFFLVLLKDSIYFFYCWVSFGKLTSNMYRFFMYSSLVYYFSFDIFIFNSILIFYFNLYAYMIWKFCFMIKIFYYYFSFYYLWYYYNIYIWIFSRGIVSCSISWFNCLQTYCIDHLLKRFILFWFYIVVNIYVYYHWSVGCVFYVLELVKDLASFCFLFSIFGMDCSNNIVMYYILLILYVHSYRYLFLIVKYVQCLLCWNFLILNYCCAFSIVYVFIVAILCWIILTYFSFGTLKRIDLICTVGRVCK